MCCAGSIWRRTNRRKRWLIAAERELSGKLLDVYLRTLHPITPAQAAGEPIHRLFYERLIDPPNNTFPGGRYRNFYVGQPMAFPGIELEWEAFSTARIVINGIHYRHSVAELFSRAAERLKPERMADAGGVVAHGDAHNANVWYSAKPGGAELSYFDPAFAGEHVPTLLAEVKTTFHNIFAHPLWLYDPAEAASRYSSKARYEQGTLFLDTDWQLSRVRDRLLTVKAEYLWRPLLVELKARGLLPDDWRTVVRSALFLCPTLVMNLRAGASSHNALSSLIAFSVAVMAGSEPVEGEDVVTRFLDGIAPA
jgi:SAM-dependent methyltransferase